jgi:hypothetical protein
MEILQDLTDLVKQYDWREVASLGIGTVIGITHAAYDKIMENKKKDSAALSGAIGGGLGAYHAVTEGMLRGFTNGFMGGAAYILAYRYATKILGNKTRQ